MSFLLRTQVSRQSARAFLSAPAAPRAFSTAFVQRKSATETVKDTVKQVDRAVSDKLVDGIEISQTAAQKAKEAAESVTGMSASEAKGKASELAGQASGKASEMTGQAQGKASEMAGQAQGKAAEVSGQVQGKASEIAGEAKGKAEEVKGKL